MNSANPQHEKRKCMMEKIMVKSQMVAKPERLKSFVFDQVKRLDSSKK